VVELGGVVLAALEGAEAVEGQGLGELALGPQLLVEEQAVASQAQGVAQHGLGRAAVLAGELAEAGAVGEGVEGLGEQFGAAQPVAGAERLLGEVAPTVATAVTLDTAGLRAAGEEAGADPAPRSGGAAVECAGVVGTERGRRGLGACGHASGSMHPPRHLQSSERNSTEARLPGRDPGPIVARSLFTDATPARVRTMSTTTLPAYQNLRLERREQVTVLFVNRPQVMNAINRETLAEIADAVRAFTADASQGALVVTGQGEKAFISGADINELAPLAPGAAEDISRFGQSVV